jgi:hypothetical protein
MSFSNSEHNELSKLKAALDDLERKKKTPEYSNLNNQSKKMITDMEKATKDLFELLSKVK